MKHRMDHCTKSRLTVKAISAAPAPRCTQGVRGDDLERPYAGLAPCGPQPRGRSEALCGYGRGILKEESEGVAWVSEVILKLRITARQEVTAAMLAHLHELAEHDCFIARSIKTKVKVRSA